MKMSKNVKCPKCGKTNDLVSIDELRYPFQRLPKEVQQEIINLSDQRKGPGVMICPCGGMAVFPLDGA